MSFAAIYEFVAGNSRATPLGLFFAVLAVLSANRTAHPTWAPALYLLVLAITLATSVFENRE